MQRKKEKRYTTGEFAKLFGIKKDTLFYYDRIGLFCPDGVGENRYRYYSDAQIAPFSTLISLRELGVPLRELQAYFSSPSPERLLGLASDKIVEIDAEIRRLGEIRQLFSEIVKNTREAEEATPGKVEICQMQESWYLYSEQLDLDADTATGEQWGGAYDRFAKQAGVSGAAPIGSLVAEKDLKIGNYGKVDRLFMPCPPGEGERRPGGSYAVLYFRGAYTELPGAYGNLMEAVRASGKRPSGDAYEEYLVAELATKREEEYITKISVRVV